MGQKIDLTRQVQGILPEANGGAGPNIGQRFSDAETPSGTINGSNETFTLAFPPNPPASLLLFLTRSLQIQGTDYTLSGSTITMSAPPSSGFLTAWYRYLTFNLSLSFSDGLAISDALSIDAPAAQYPIQPLDQLVLSDAIVFFMATVFAPLSDQMVMIDLIQLINYPVQLQTEDILQMTDQLGIGYADRIADTLTLSDAVAKTNFVTSEAFLDALSFWNDSILYDLPPVTYELGDSMFLKDSFAFQTFGVLTLADFMTLSSVSDPFNATLSSAWTQMDGSLAYDGSTGLEVSTTDNNYAFMKRNDVTSLPTAQFAQNTVVAVESTGNVFIGPMINIQASGVEGYFVTLTGSALTIWKATGAGAATQLTQGGGGSREFTVGDVMYFQNNGSGTLEVYKNGSAVLGITDTSYTGGTVGVGSQGGVSLTRISTWSGGPLTPTGQQDAFAHNP